MHFFIVAVITLFTVASAHAKDITHTQAGVRYQLPDTWKVNQKDDVVDASAPDGALQLIMFGVPKAALSKTAASVPMLLDKSGMKGLEFKDAPEETTINGLQMVLREGKANAEGQPVDVGMFTFVPPTGKQALLLVGVAASGNKTKQKAMMTIITSIKPLVTTAPASTPAPTGTK